MEWERLYPSLVAHAAWLSKNLPFAKWGEELPRGNKPEDIAQEAVTLVFEGKRRWDPEKDPDLASYLKGVIRSRINNLVQSADNRRRVSGSDGEAFDIDGHVGESRPDPSALSASSQCVEALRAIMDQATIGDPDLALVAAGLENGMSSGEIAQELSMDIDNVYRLARKLRRRLISAMPDHECWQGHPFTKPLAKQ